MATLELDESSLRKGWGGANEYWFSLRDYKIKSIARLSELEHSDDVSQSEYLISLGYIPYFSVTGEEVIRAFLPTLQSQKLRDKLEKYSGSDFVENFWKYFHIYPEISESYVLFEHEYVKQKAIEWCEENAINYSVNQ